MSFVNSSYNFTTLIFIVQHFIIFNKDNSCSFLDVEGYRNTTCIISYSFEMDSTGNNFIIYQRYISRDFCPFFEPSKTFNQ